MQFQYSKCFFGRGVTLPDRSEVSLAATTPCRLQLCTVLKGWDGKCLVTTNTCTAYQHCTDFAKRNYRTSEQTRIYKIQYIRYDGQSGANIKKISTLTVAFLPRKVYIYQKSSRYSLTSMPHYSNTYTVCTDYTNKTIYISQQQVNSAPKCCPHCSTMRCFNWYRGGSYTATCLGTVLSNCESPVQWRIYI